MTELATPTLMRLARGAYAQAIRAQLQQIGVDDLPRNGAFMLAGIGAGSGAAGSRAAGSRAAGSRAEGGPRADLPRELGVTKQAVSQLIDVLVSRGYLERGADAGDLRRIALALTGRGREVVEAVARGVDAVDGQLGQRMPDGHLEAMRAGLIALAAIKAEDLATGTGVRRPARPDRQLRRFSPIFGVSDLAAALEHYASLGFRTSADDDAGHYGFADRDGVGLHLHAAGAHSPRGAAYLYVHDADALYEEWSRPGIGGHTHPAGPTDYGLREGSHTDPDGNLIRFGSPIQEGPTQEGPSQEQPSQEQPTQEQPTQEGLSQE
jgi:DNA-binding MarR family transcriptional regulator/catechol 2,3-dioxygenase-like lactoylglutathione lyase family enzyme